METDGGGWIVFQRRQDGSVDFYRNWTDYENGFGNLNGEFWLGLRKIHRLTQERSNILRVDLGDFDGNRTYAQYSVFNVRASTTEYRLTATNYSGNAGESLGKQHSGSRFSTADNDNDRADHNCAKGHKGAWWFSRCLNSHLNGYYYHNATAGRVDGTAMGIIWYKWKGFYYSLKFSEMKMILS